METSHFEIFSYTVLYIFYFSKNIIIIFLNEIVFCHHTIYRQNFKRVFDVIIMYIYIFLFYSCFV